MLRSTAFTQLEQRGVFHGDIHPGNILVDPKSDIHLLDFALSQIHDKSSPMGRGGIGFFFEPEYAQASLERKRHPGLTSAGQIYSLGALLQLLLVGRPYLNFSLDKRVSYQQIVEEPALQLSEPWSYLAPVFGRALAKQPEKRFTDTNEFLIAFEDAGTPSRHAPCRTVPVDSIVEDFIAMRPPKREPFASIMAGGAGTAYALYRISIALRSPALLSEADIELESMLLRRNERAAFWSDSAGVLESQTTTTSIFFASPGLFAVQAILAACRGDQFVFSIAQKDFLNSINEPTNSSIDLLFGLPGKLITLIRLIRASRRFSHVSESLLLKCGDEIFQECLSHLAFESKRGPQFKGLLGLAHGWGGVLYALISWVELTGTNAPEVVKIGLQKLAAMSEVQGKCLAWSRKANNREYLSSWCNGSAGLAQLWALCHKVVPNMGYDKLAVGAGEYSWMYPQFGYDLCCGAAGRIYTMGCLYKMTGDSLWMNRAQAIADGVSDCLLEVGKGRWEGLFKGKIGLLIAIAELENGNIGEMPFIGAEP